MSTMLRNEWSLLLSRSLVLKLPEQVPIVNFLTEAEIKPVLVLKNLWDWGTVWNFLAEWKLLWILSKPKLRLNYFLYTQYVIWQIFETVQIILTSYRFLQDSLGVATSNNVCNAKHYITLHETVTLWGLLVFFPLNHCHE